MVDQNFFITGLFIFTAILIATVIYILKTNEGTVPAREKLARCVSLGTALIFIDFLWCVPISQPIAPDFIVPYIWPLAFILTAIGYKFSDFHFARATGGFLILTSSFFLTNLWAFGTPESSIIAKFFALFCILLGIAGLFISGKPYLFRDWFRKFAKTPKLKLATAIYLILFSALNITLAITLL